jgi:hypothetical protein
VQQGNSIAQAAARCLAVQRQHDFHQAARRSYWLPACSAIQTFHVHVHATPLPGPAPNNLPACCAPLQSIRHQGEILGGVYRTCINVRMIDAQQRGTAPAGVSMPVLAEAAREALIEMQDLHEGGWSVSQAGKPAASSGTEIAYTLSTS